MDAVFVPLRRWPKRQPLLFLLLAAAAWFGQYQVLMPAAEALTDLERLVEFLLEQAPASAPAVLERVTNAITILTDHPLIGRRVEGELRELVILRGAPGYLALYRFDPVREIARILRVRHQSEAGYRD